MTESTFSVPLKHLLNIIKTHQVWEKFCCRWSEFKKTRTEHQTHKHTHTQLNTWLNGDSISVSSWTSDLIENILNCFTKLQTKTDGQINNLWRTSVHFTSFKPSCYILLMTEIISVDQFNGHCTESMRNVYTPTVQSVERDEEALASVAIV